ncbi:MAG: DUF3574 domain-containing protein [Oscillospiraceae bacterium]|nr:DUF3574 domain-containing protein [Oscillospiraceae bacterium]MBR7010673.1 DUF3574 domain-containing protein [Oscillospiraceae bacterium]
MNKKLGTLSLILAALALCVSLVTLGLTLRKNEAPAQNADPTGKGEVQYVLYLGTNDKDSNAPKFSPEEAKAQVDAVLTDYFQGFTIQEATGGWVGDNGAVYHEYTLVIYLSDTDLDQVHRAADALIRTFNQSSVLIQSNLTQTEFYSTKNQ